MEQNVDQFHQFMFKPQLSVSKGFFPMEGNAGLTQNFVSNKASLICLLFYGMSIFSDFNCRITKWLSWMIEGLNNCTCHNNKAVRPKEGAVAGQASIDDLLLSNLIHCSCICWFSLFYIPKALHSLMNAISSLILRWQTLCLISRD